MMNLYYGVTVEQTGEQEWTVKVYCDQMSGSLFQRVVKSDPDVGNFVRQCTMELIDNLQFAEKEGK